MPCEPSSSSSRAITRSIGSRGGSGSSPTWTWRPRLRSPAIEAAQAASAPIASRLTCAPPPVSSRTSAPARAVHLRARPARGVQRVVGHVDRHDPRAESRGDHHRREPDAAAAVDRDPLARLRAADLHDRAIGGGEAAAEAGRSVGADRLGQRDEVDVGPVERDELGEGAPVREARLALAIADLLVARGALLAVSARAHERDGHARARRPLRTSGPTASTTPASSWPGTWGKRADVRVVAHPAVPVRAAQAGRLDPDHDAVERRRGVGDRVDARRLPESFVEHGPHAGRGYFGETLLDPVERVGDPQHGVERHRRAELVRRVVGQVGDTPLARDVEPVEEGVPVEPLARRRIDEQEQPVDVEQVDALLGDLGPERLAGELVDELRPR